MMIQSLVNIPTGWGGMAAAAVQGLIIVSSYPAQTSPKTATPYSKFFVDNGE